MHRSYQNENPNAALGTNERLEFLGDSVLGFVVTEELYRRFPSMSEGEMTNFRSALVRTQTLARLSRGLGIGRFLLLGRGEEAAGGRDREQILAGAFEAVLGAIYLAAGLDATHAFVLRQLEEGFGSGPSKDDKSRLQELTQARWQVTPLYTTLGSTGPEHAKQFQVQVQIGDEVMGQGEGRTKQAAEQAAARQALVRLQAESGAGNAPANA